MFSFVEKDSKRSFSRELFEGELKVKVIVQQRRGSLAISLVFKSERKTVVFQVLKNIIYSIKTIYKISL